MATHSSDRVSRPPAITTVMTKAATMAAGRACRSCWCCHDAARAAGAPRRLCPVGPLVQRRAAGGVRRDVGGTPLLDLCRRCGRGPPSGREPLAARGEPQHRGAGRDERPGQPADRQPAHEHGDGEDAEAEPGRPVGLADVPTQDRRRAGAGSGDECPDAQQLGRAVEVEAERGERRLGQDVADGLLGLERAERGDPLEGGEQHHHRGEHDDARRQGDLGRTLLGGLAHATHCPQSHPTGPHPGGDRTRPGVFSGSFSGLVWALSPMCAAAAPGEG